MGKFKVFVKNNKAPILIWSGVACLFGATIASIPMTVKATHAVDKKKKELGKDRLDFKNFVKVVWPYYIPTAVCAGVSIPLVICGNKEYGKKIISYAAIASSATNNLKQLEDKIPQIVGEDKAKEIKQSVAQDKVNKTASNQTVIVTGSGETLFYEPITNQLFKSSMTEIDKIANALSAQVNDDIEGTVTFSDFLYRVGLASDNPVIDNYVWTNRKSYSKGLVKINYTPTIRNNQACIVLGYENLALRTSDGEIDYDWR